MPPTLLTDTPSPSDVPRKWQPATQAKPPTSAPVEAERDFKSEPGTYESLFSAETMDGMVQQLEQSVKKVQERVEENKTSISAERQSGEVATASSPAPGISRSGLSHRDLHNIQHRLKRIEDDFEDLRDEHEIARENWNTEIDAKIEEQLENFKPDEHSIEELKASLKTMGDDIEQTANMATDHITKQTDEMRSMQTKIEQFESSYTSVR